MKLGVSLVVCTYNGAMLLPATIQHIAKQRVGTGIEWEVLIVDNASTDNTQEVVMEEIGKYANCNVQFTFLHQAQPGLTYARLLALKKAQYEYILFCDDDNLLYQDYVMRAYDLMCQYPAIGVLGGKGDLVFEEAPPLWAAKPSFIANGPQAKTPGVVMAKVVYGAGCVIRKSALVKLEAAGFKPMLTDRVGKDLSSGGDYEVCYAIALAGYDIWYDDQLRFSHFVQKQRISWNYYKRLVTESVRSFEILMPYRICLEAGNSNQVFFHICLLKIVFCYLLRLLPVLWLKKILPPNSEAALKNELRFIALKAKILSFRASNVMWKNFTGIMQIKANLRKKTQAPVTD